MTYTIDAQRPAGLPTPPPTVNLLIADPDASSYVSVLRNAYRLTLTSNIDEAMRQLGLVGPEIVIAGLEVPNGSALELCTRAKNTPADPSVLVTTDDPHSVPDALLAGCDSVLLKPFAPNLVLSRLSLLTRARQLRYRAERQRAKASHLRERSDLIRTGGLVEWPNTHCPQCDHSGVTTFDFASHRRAWFACLECKNVWMAKPPE